MPLLSYLPSSQFLGIVGSIALAGTLILGANYVANPPADTATVAAGATTTEVDWKAALEEVQATAPGLPEAPSEDSVAQLLGAAQSPNVTDTVARSLFINLSDAAAQGLGSDIPTQEKLIADAQKRIPAAEGAVYTSADITVVPQNKDSLRTWGNSVMGILDAHPAASVDRVFAAMAAAFDRSDASALYPLEATAEAYGAITKELKALPVPQTLAPLHLQLVNNFARMAYACGEMQTAFSDPLRGLAGLQTYQAAGGEAARVLTALAEQLNKNGILFTKDEPGNTWNVFISAYAQ